MTPFNQNPMSRNIYTVRITARHKEALSLFRLGRCDTAAIAERIKIDEALAYRLVSEARDAERMARL